MQAHMRQKEFLNLHGLWCSQGKRPPHGPSGQSARRYTAGTTTGECSLPTRCCAPAATRTGLYIPWGQGGLACTPFSPHVPLPPHLRTRYNAIVTGVTASGNFIVAFEGYGNEEEVQKGFAQLREGTDGGDGAAGDGGEYRPVAAPKKRHMFEDIVPDEMPKWLEIKPTGVGGGEGRDGRDGRSA
jgi:hypothetical protein